MNPIREQKVSIIMPAYNAEQYIEESILSVLNQTYKNFELIIVNDFSNDNTLGIINKYKLIDKRILLINNSENLGVVISRNKAIDLATGSYLAFLDSDDIWLPLKLDKQITFMIENNYYFTYSQYEMFKDYDIKYKKVVKVPNSLNYRQALHWTIIGCLTVIYNVEKIGKFKMPKLKHGEDSFTWLAILKKGIVAYGIQETLARYRKLRKSRSSNKLNSVKFQFQNYHNYLKFNLLKSIWLTINYSIRAYIKHL
jgi:teichuronic acid biosynthesis glycosyltransferase TuaG